MPQNDVPQVLQLDGASAALELAAARRLGLGPGDFTVEAWVCVDAWGTLYLPVLGTDEAAQHRGLHLAIKDQKPYLGFYESDTPGQTELEPGVWYHLAWRFTAAGGEQAIFVNGVLDASASGREPYLGSDEVVSVGRYAVDHHFGGRVAELRVWRAARSAGEILAGMHVRLRGDEEHLAAYWPLDEVSGEQAPDLKSAPPATGEAVVAKPQAAPPDPRLVRVRRHGEPGKLPFRALRRGDDAPRDILLGYQKTYEFWFCSTAPSRHLLTLRGDESLTPCESYIHLKATASGTLETHTLQREGEHGSATFRDTNDFVDQIEPILDGRWHHLALTVSSSYQWYLYLDGNKVRDFTFRTDAGKRYFDSVTFGQHMPHDVPLPDGPCEYAEFRVWDEYRNQSTIQANMPKRLGRETSKLLYHLPFYAGGGEVSPLHADTVANSGDFPFVEPEARLPLEAPPRLWLDGDQDAIDLELPVAPAAGAGRVGLEVVSFDGESGRVALGDGVALGLAFTQEAWVRTTATDSQPRQVFGGNFYDEDCPLRVGLAHGRYIDAKVKVGTSTRSAIYGPVENADTWNHLAATGDGDAFKIYWNGEEIGSFTESRRPDSTLVRYLGSTDEWNYFQGEIAEARLWSQALTSTQIKARMGQRLTGQEEGLVGYWPLDSADGGKAEDLSPGGCEGTLETGAALTASEGLSLAAASGSVGEDTGEAFDLTRAMSFDGSNDYLEIPGIDALSREQYTVSFWCKMTGGNTSHRCPMGFRDSSYNGFLFMAMDGVQWKIALFDQAAGWVSLLGPQTVVGSWVHLALTCSGDTVTFYVDGELVASQGELSLQPNVSRPLRVGTSDNVNAYFQGQIAEVRIWDRVREAEEILADKDRRLTGREEGLLGYWPLDFVDNGKVLDLSPAKNHGLVKNGAALVDASGLELRRRPAPGPYTYEGWVRPEGRLASSSKVLSFDGSNDYVSVPYSSALNLSAFSVSIWAKATHSLTQSLSPISRYAGGNFRIRGLSGVWKGYVYGTNASVIVGPKIVKDAWVHLCLTFGNKTSAFYVNGKLVGDVSNITHTPSNTNHLTIGCESDKTYYFPGQLAEARLWNYARTQEQIRKDMWGRLKGDEEGLVAYWPLDGSGGSSAADLTGNGHDGTLNNGPYLEAAPELPVGPLEPPASSTPSGDRWSTLVGEPASARALSFDGSSDYVEVPCAEAMSCSAFTISLFVRVAGGADKWRRLIRLSGFSFFVSYKSEWDFTLANTGVADLYAGAAAYDTWVHLAGVFDGSKKFFYVDGNLKAQADVANRQPRSQGLFVGGKENDAHHGFVGEMAAIVYWDHARSRAQILQDMKTFFTGSEEGLVACWPMDEVVDGKVEDLGPNGLHGTVHGDPTVVSARGLPSIGQVDFLSIREDGSLRHCPPTASASAGPEDAPAGSLPWETWSHVAATHDGETARTLVNGEVVSEAAAGDLGALPERLRIGSGFRGALAELRTWNVARSPQQIQADKDRQLTGQEEGLVGYWPGTEASGSTVYNVVSDSGHGTLEGGHRRLAYYEPFPDEEICHFDGQASSLEIPHLPELDFARPEDDFTLEVLARAVTERGSAGGEQVIVEKWSGIGSFPYSLRYQPTSGRFLLARSTGADPETRVESDGLFSDSAFHHLAAVKQGSTLRLYVDGEEQGTAALTIATRIRGEAPIYLGSRGGESHFFEGSLSELRLWRGARTQNQIQASMRQRLAGDEVGLVGYWPLRELEEGAAASALRRASGTLAGGSWIADESLPLLGFVDAPFATAPAACFDGFESAIAVPVDPEEATPALMPTSTLTVEAWVRPRATGGQAFAGPVVAAADAMGGWELRATDAEVDFLVTVDGNQHQVRCASVSGADRWLHLAGIYDGSSLRLYQNGVSMPGSVESVGGQITPYAGNLSLGAHPYWPGRHFTGQLAEVRVWRAARTPAQIHQSLFRRLNGEEAGLAGYWPLDDGEGDQARCRGGAAEHGEGTALEWMEADLPPRVEPAATLDPHSHDRLASLQELYDDLLRRLESEDAQITTLDLQRFELKRQVEEQEALLETKKAEHSAPYEADVALLDGRIAKIEAERAEIEGAGADTFIDSLIRDTHQQIDEARKDMVARGGRTNLDKVTMELRYLATAEGRGAVFPPIDTPVEPEAISTLQIDFEPVRPSAPPAQPASQVPDLAGMTWGFAERKLAAAGFVAERHAQAVHDVAGQPSRGGRVVSQLPKAGAAASPGDLVRLFVGKESS